MLLETLLDQIQVAAGGQSLRFKGKIPGSLGVAPVEAVISPKSNQKQPWEFDRDKYRWQHLIENFYTKCKQ